MAISNLETTIDDIEQLIERVRPDNKGKIVLPKAELKQLLDELKNSIPSEIKRFNDKTRELERSKSQEIEKARENAERIMREANSMRDKLLDENEQVKIAEERANQIISQANARAQEIISNSENASRSIQEKALKEYDDSLIYIINYIQTLGKDTTEMLNNNVNILRNKLNEVMNIRNSLQESIQKRNDIENQKQVLYRQNNNTNPYDVNNNFY